MAKANQKQIGDTEKHAATQYREALKQQQIIGKHLPKFPQQRQDGGIERRVFSLWWLTGQADQVITITLGQRFGHDEIDAVVVTLTGSTDINPAGRDQHEYAGK